MEISITMTVLVLAVILNLLAHLFLVRFFQWYNKDSRINPSGKPLKTKFLAYVLLVPPLALVTAVFLVSLGLLLQIFNKRNKRK